MLTVSCFQCMSTAAILGLAEELTQTVRPSDNKARIPRVSEAQGLRLPYLQLTTRCEPMGGHNPTLCIATEIQSRPPRIWPTEIHEIVEIPLSHRV